MTEKYGVKNLAASTKLPPAMVEKTMSPVLVPYVFVNTLVIAPVVVATPVRSTALKVKALAVPVALL